MNYDYILESLCGLSIFLFSLRIMNSVIDETISIRLGHLFQKLNKHPWASLFTGIFFSATFQSSSLTILTSMGFLSKGLLTFETSLMIMLGASLGTTLKAWIFLFPVNIIGPIIITISSFLLIFLKDLYYRKIAELLLAVGLMFLGWKIIGEGVNHMIDSPQILNLLKSYNGSNFKQLFMLMIIGVILSILFQSSSTVVFLVIGAVMNQKLAFNSSMAIILGANIGTTLTGILASFEYGVEVKRLAFAHFFVKFLGAFMAILFFKTFLHTIEFIFSPFMEFKTVGIKLAAIHTGHNIINLLIWSTFLPILMKIVRFFMPQKVHEASDIWTRSNVQKLLVQLPEHAVLELQVQFNNLVLSTKAFHESLEKRLFDLESSKNLNLKIKEIEIALKASQNILLGIIHFHPEFNTIGQQLLQSYSQLRKILEKLNMMTTQIDSIGQKKIHGINEVFPDIFKNYFSQIEIIWKKILLSTQGPFNSEKSKKSLYAQFLENFTEHKISKYNTIIFELYYSLDELKEMVAELEKTLN